MAPKSLILMRKSLLVGTGIFLILVSLLIFSNFYTDLPVEELKQKYTNDASQFIEIDGLKVHYRDEGEGNPLVLLHGTAASLHTWDGWVEQLADSFRIIRLDLPAFGLTGSNSEHDYSTDAYVDFLRSFLGKLNIESFYLAGNSLGGRIAWNYAAKYPEGLRKLVLLAPSGFTLSDIEEPEKKPMAFRLASNSALNWMVRYVSPRSLVRNSLHEVYADDTKVNEPLVERYHDLLRRQGNREAFLARVQQIYQDDPSKLTQIKAPVLLLWGEEDKWLPVEMLEKYKEVLPNSESIVYPEVGHVPMEEVPSVTAKDAMHFLKKPILDALLSTPNILNP